MRQENIFLTGFDWEGLLTFLSRRSDDILELTIDHLVVVLISLAFAMVIGIGLGILVRGRRFARSVVLTASAVAITIPSLALLALLSPVLGLGWLPTVVALVFYSLLPIVRNTHAALVSLDPRLVEMTKVLGVTGWRRLAWIELPMASTTIMAGIKTSAVLTVGTATLAAFIGGGGYGTLIVTGLALNDVATILSGAIPSAVMALAIHALFEALDRLLIPRPLRARAG